MTDEERINNFIENIPYGRLYDKIREVTGIGDLNFERKVTTRYDGVPIIKFTSNDLVDRIGFLNLMIKHIYITQFNSEVKIDSRTNRAYWWGTVAFSYEHQPCGSNGHTFMTFRYTEFGDWEFELNKDRG